MTTTKNESHTYKAFKDIFAGTLAGINVTLVGHPFDTLKVRLQTQPQQNPLYKGLIDCLTKTIKWEGVGGLYSGVASPLIGQMFFRTALFFSFGETKRQLAMIRHDGKLRKSDFFLAGGFSWGIGSLIECPVDVFKTQLQIQIIKTKTIPGYISPYTSIISCAKYILEQNGLKGAYKGLLAHLMRNIPAGAVHLGLFETIRTYLAKKNNISTSQLNIGQNMFAGGIGGFFFWFLFFPFDVVKSSLQGDNILKDQRKYKGLIDCYCKLYQEGGWRRFYRGFSPCILRAIPANAVMLYTVAFVTDRM